MALLPLEAAAVDYRGSSPGLAQSVRRPRMASKEKSGKKIKKASSASLKEKRAAKKAKKAARGS